MGATFPVIPDTNRAIADAYHVEATPDNVIVGRSGAIEQTLEGYAPDLLDQAVQKVMGDQ